MEKKVVFGIGWYEEEQWPEYLRLMEDDVAQPYSDWLKSAKALERQIKKEGNEVARVHIDLDEFELWCTVRKKKRNAAARAAYIAEKQQQQC